MHQEDKREAGEIVVNNRFLTWLDNFWYHYKWHVLVSAFFLLICVICFAQCSTRETGDVTVTFAGGYSMTAEEQATLKTTLNAVAPARKEGEGTLSTMLSTYSIFTEEELRALFTDEEGNFDNYAFQTAKGQSAEQLETFSSFVKTGESSILLVSPEVYEVQNLDYLAVPLSELFDTLPNGAYDAYAIRLADTEFYQYYEAIQFLPEDTLIVMLQPMLLWGQSSDAEKYDTFLAMYYAIVNAKAQ